MSATHHTTNGKHPTLIASRSSVAAPDQPFTTALRDPAEVASAFANLGRAIRADSLTRFRTMWLRAVALAWVNQDFAEAMIGNPIVALQDRFGFEWPWKDSLTLIVKELQDFKWVGDDWVWPNDQAKEEGITLRIPLLGPPNQEEHAIALAAYYDQRPSLLSDDNVDMPSSLINPSAFNVSEALATFMGSRSRSTDGLTFSQSRSFNGSFMPNPTSFLDFQVVLISLMAKAWENKNFRDLIRENKNINSALASIRGYAHPWRLNLRIEHDAAAVWNSGNGTWTDLSKHELMLHLPLAPTEIREQSIALATYNSTGADFCFSCCA